MCIPAVSHVCSFACILVHAHLVTFGNTCIHKYSHASTCILIHDPHSLFTRILCVLHNAQASFCDGPLQMHSVALHCIHMHLDCISFTQANMYLCSKCSDTALQCSGMSLNEVWMLSYWMQHTQNAHAYTTSFECMNMCRYALECNDAHMQPELTCSRNEGLVKCNTWVMQHK